MTARLSVAAVAVSVALGLVAATASAQTVSFASPRFLSTGAGADGVAIADFNGDGIPDLAVVNPAGSVSVYLGNGHGGFTANGPFAVAGSPQSIAVADFNGDGLPDIVTADGNGTSVSVLMNTSTKGASTVTFAGHKDFTVGSYPAAIAIGDFNRDGLPDIATANYGSGNVSVLLDTTAKDSSTAGFATHADFSVQSEPELDRGRRPQRRQQPGHRHIKPVGLAVRPAQHDWLRRERRHLPRPADDHAAQRSSDQARDRRSRRRART